MLLWSSDVAAARAALETLGRGAEALTRAGVGSIAIAVDAPQDQASLRTPSSGATPVVMATPEVSLSYAILNRHLFMNRQDLRLPTCLLLDGSGNVVKVYRDRVDVDQIVKDASAIDVSPAERLARAVPFQGTFYSGLPRRNYLPYGRELLDQRTRARRGDGVRARGRRRTRARRRCIVWARCSPEAGRRPAPAPRSSAPSPCNRIWPRPTTISERCSRRAAISTRPSAGFVRRWRRLRSTPTR